MSESERPNSAKPWRPPMPERPQERQTTIYAVESGSYDEYTVEALFTDEDEAKRYAAWRNGPDAATHGETVVVDRVVDEAWEPTGHYGSFAFLDVDGRLDNDTFNHSPDVFCDECGPAFWEPDLPVRDEVVVERYKAGWSVKSYAPRKADAIRRLREKSEEIAAASKKGADL